MKLPDPYAEKRQKVRDEFIKDRDTIDLLALKYSKLAEAVDHPDMRATLMAISRQLKGAADMFGGRR